jgi:N-acyl-L-homoserine lactone synthetase
MAASAALLPLGLADRVQLLLQRVEYRRADTDDDREAIYRLRYDAYLREGAIEPSFGRRFSDAYDDLDNAWIVGTHLDGRLVSSMRIHVGTSDYPEMVASNVFPEYVRPELDAGKTIIDPTRFVVDPAMARAYPDLSYVTVRIGHMAAEHFDADIVLATVRAEHQAFYKRVFGHTTVCPPRPYPTLIKPLSLMMLDYPANRDEIMRRYPFFGSTAAERVAVFGQPVPSSRRRVAAAGDRPALVG